MKAITLWQPWASLLVLGHKKFETRPKRFALFGKPIYVHAALAMPVEIATAADLQAIAAEHLGTDWRATVPRGVIIGQVNFIGIISTTTHRRDQTPNEIAMGDWRAERWAYQVGSRQTFDHPFPCRGQQAVPFDVPQPIADAIKEAA